MSSQFNKWAGGILSALLVIVGSRVLVHETLQAHAPEKPGFEVAVAETDHGTEAPAVAAPEPPIGPLLAAANPESGQKGTKPCLACHTFEKGGANKVGPNLYGIVGRALASVDGFSYSTALKTHGGSWGYEELAKYLANPKGYIPGNKMAFAGVKKPEDRANLIIYLRSLADTPAPLPQ